jgi:hypothetical protein
VRTAGQQTASLLVFTPGIKKSKPGRLAQGVLIFLGEAYVSTTRFLRWLPEARAWGEQGFGQRNAVPRI